MAEIHGGLIGRSEESFEDAALAAMNQGPRSGRADAVTQLTNLVLTVESGGITGKTVFVVKGQVVLPD